MTSLTPIETATLERASDAPMLAQVERWAAVNSGTGNLHGLKTVAGLIAAAFAVLPGALRLVAPDPVESVEIGRASCRERVCQYVLISVVAVSLKKKQNTTQHTT